MKASVTFKHLGLTFDADCYVEPLVRGYLSGPPEACYPDEGGYVEIESLTCDGADASFLLGSTIREDLETAAYAAMEAEEVEP